MIRPVPAFRIDRFAASPIIRNAKLSLAGVIGLLTVGVTAAADAPRKLVPPAAASPAAARKTIVDSAVMPAGGGCRHCASGGCRHGHSGHGHHAGCRNGQCVPYCPVRPDKFGFYDTQWRKWPGQGVVPTSATEMATPVLPPKSELPNVDQESFGPPAGDVADPAPARPALESRQTPAPQQPADPLPVIPEPEPQQPETAEPDVPAPQPEPPPAPEPEAIKPAQEPAAEAPAAEPTQPVAPETPAPKAPEKKSDDLFDEAATGRVQRVFVAARDGEARQPSASNVRQVSHRSPATAAPASGRPAATGKNVPRVSFDPRAEAEALRTIR